MSAQRFICDLFIGTETDKLSQEKKMGVAVAQVAEPALTWIGGGEADYCSRDGAQVLKERIEAYWRERGMAVTIALANVGFHPAIRAARYELRSDMLNGFPRGGTKPDVKGPRLVELPARDDDDFEGDLD